MSREVEGRITKRILKCIKGIEKHGFRMERQQEELKKWLSQNKISYEGTGVNSVGNEVNKLIEQHNGKPLIKKLQKLGITLEEEVENEETPLYKEKE